MSSGEWRHGNFRELMGALWILAIGAPRPIAGVALGALWASGCFGSVFNRLRKVTTCGLVDANTVLIFSAVRQVRANAETATDARAAKRFGAQGIGLVRTEHMFFEASFYQSLR